MIHESSNITIHFTNSFIHRLFDSFVHSKLLINSIYDGMKANIKQNIKKMDIRDAFLPGVVLDFARETKNQTMEDFAIELLNNFLDVFNITNDSSLPPLIIEFNFNESSTFAEKKVYNDTFEFVPELYESLYIFWKETKDIKYRDIAWLIFEKFSKECRTEYGYSNLENNTKVNKVNPLLFSATFKYLYLMFNDHILNNYDDWVFNHHGHPLHVWDRKDENFDEIGFKKLPIMYDLSETLDHPSLIN